MAQEAAPYFNVTTIAVRPGKIDEVYASFAELAREVMEHEPDAKMYRFYKTQGKDEIVIMEKFASREAFFAHLKADHMAIWKKKYASQQAEWFTGADALVARVMAADGPAAGGFDRP
ncbi:hypothetical protein VTK73DRAFT_2113 [Phialemonium thermophilum]|uniref:ABM domain-containing protein n=1 Tax=Phialemonium thermophilum TaxID=223376 RepID=A0ABR3X6N1_9PEZI